MVNMIQNLSLLLRLAMYLPSKQENKSFFAVIYSQRLTWKGIDEKIIYEGKEGIQEPCYS